MMALLLTVFMLGAGAMIATVAAVTYLPGRWARRRLDQRLRQVAGMPLEHLATSQQTVIKRRTEGPLPWLDQLLEKTPVGTRLSRLIDQSGRTISAGTVVLLGLGLAVVAAVVVAIFVQYWWAALAAAAVGASAPVVVLMRMRTRRLRRFEEQFPEALDLLSRAIRAGHAFTTAMGMVADDAGDPTGPEFKKTFEEQNFGLPLKDALNAMTERVPLLDVRFFVTAVLIQRETGGNLSEILDNLAHVVRERFKILRQVRVHTAHGRFTGFVLMALPAALAIALAFINPDHMQLLFRERMGQTMLTGAIILQTIGYFWIRHVIKIEV